MFFKEGLSRTTLILYPTANFTLPFIENILQMSNATQIMQFIYQRTENIVEKEKNAGDKHFLLFL